MAILIIIYYIFDDVFRRRFPVDFFYIIFRLSRIAGLPATINLNLIYSKFDPELKIFLVFFFRFRFSSRTFSIDRKSNSINTFITSLFFIKSITEAVFTERQKIITATEKIEEERVIIKAETETAEIIKR